MQISQENLNSFLNIAVRENNYEQAEKYLQKGAGANLQDNQENPLHLAAFTGNARMIALLLDHGVSNSTLNTEGKMPIELVAEQDWVSYLAFALHKNDIDPSTKKRAGYHIALMNAVKHNNIEVAEALLKAGADTSIKYTDNTAHYYLIHVAAKHGNLAMIQLLFKYGVSFETEREYLINSYKNKPILILAQNNHWDCVKWVADNQREESKDKFMYGSALLIAAQKKPINEKERQDTLRNVLKDNSEWEIDSITQVIRENDSLFDKPTDAAESLIKAGASLVRYMADTLNTALHFAAQEGNPRLIRTLLSHGADNTKQNKSGKTPIELVDSEDLDSYLAFALYKNDETGAARYDLALINAVRHNQLEVAEALLNAGACTSVKYSENNCDYYLIHIVAEMGNLLMVDLFLRHGVDFSALKEDKSAQRITKAVSILAEKKHWDCVKWVARHKKESKPGEFFYGHALLYAVNEGLTDVAESLLKAGANTTCCWETKNTALHEAVIKKHLRMQALLLKYKAKSIGIQNNNKKTPIKLAEDMSNFQMMDCFLEPEKVGVGAADDILALGNLYCALQQKDSIISMFPAEVLELIIYYTFNDLSFFRRKDINVTQKIYIELYFNSIRTICAQYALHIDKKVIDETNLDFQLIKNLRQTINSRIPIKDKLEQCEVLISDYLENIDQLEKDELEKEAEKDKGTEKTAETIVTENSTTFISSIMSFTPFFKASSEALQKTSIEKEPEPTIFFSPVTSITSLFWRGSNETTPTPVNTFKPWCKEAISRYNLTPSTLTKESEENSPRISWNN